MFFEVLGEIQTIETFAYGSEIREVGRLRRQYGIGCGESEKALHQCACQMAQYVLLKFTGMRPQALANVKLKVNAIWMSEHVESFFCCLCQ